MPLYDIVHTFECTYTVRVKCKDAAEAQTVANKSARDQLYPRKYAQGPCTVGRNILAKTEVNRVAPRKRLKIKRRRVSK